jgi:SAM-dependent methyltransferase
MDQRVPYDILAGEYYDDRHVTSRNFDAATILALSSRSLLVPEGRTLEAGSGRGRCGEYLGLPPERVVQLDNSPTMLTISPRERASVRVCHDAEQLPFPASEFEVVAAFLCDPFLGLNFLAEARRVLQRGGLLIGTTPTKEWGDPLRRVLGIDGMMTRFQLRDGRIVQVPSALYSSEHLNRMLCKAGFVETSIDIRSHRLPPNTPRISPDIEAAASARGVPAYELDILYTFTAEA